jgi:hypothetical protein
MLPRTHEAILRAAVLRGGSTWRERDLDALVRGHRDEDDFVVLRVLRFRAPGLTHTYRPGQRFGELFAENAKSKMLRCVRRAERNRTRTAWWLGRACHLLADMAVPARTRGVWHLLGDPLEAWLEEDARRVDALACDPLDVPSYGPAELADALAHASAAHVADTTRTPWAKILYGRTEKFVRLCEKDVEAQARTLVPLAVAHTAALLRAVPRL